MPTAEALTLSISVTRDWREAYAVAHVPQTFPRWASGLATGLEPDREGWIAQGPAGRVHIHFSPPNDFGVLDHVVVTEAGATIVVPMRIVPNGDGSEVLLTLFRQPDMDDQRFAADAAWVRRDLMALKALLEGESAA